MVSAHIQISMWSNWGMKIIVSIAGGSQTELATISHEQERHLRLLTLDVKLQHWSLAKGGGALTIRLIAEVDVLWNLHLCLL